MYSNKDLQNVTFDGLTIIVKNTCISTLYWQLFPLKLPSEMTFKQKNIIYQ